ncbi:sulfite reductase (NADPH) hemoprotein beta-component [Pseudohyphozyma bogoriensis]|nr:sulfite reductase (NADPH) hemoprotein beta-component [Pseudohyphozyma bogoriensis]
MVSSSSLYSSVSTSLPLPAASSSSGAPALLILPPSHLITLLPSLKQLVSTPVVIQVATTGDHAQVLALKSAGLALVYSSSPAQAKDNAVVAARVASVTRKAVLHFGEFGQLSTEGSLPAAGAVEKDVAKAFAAAFDKSSTAATSTTGAAAPKTLLLVLGDASPFTADLPADWAVTSISLYRPIKIADLIPKSVETVVVLEQNYGKAKYNPLFLDVVGSYAEAEDNAAVPKILSGTIGVNVEASAARAAIEDAIKSSTNPFLVSTLPYDTSASTVAAAPKIPTHESTYTSLLSEVFGDRLWVSNAPKSLLPSPSSTISATSPEYALGHVLGSSTKRASLLAAVRSALASSSLDSATKKTLSDFLQNDRSEKFAAAAASAVAGSTDYALASVKEIIEQPDVPFVRKSNWIIGSEAWSHDLGSSGLHHALSTGADVNLLIIDTTPYELPSPDSPAARRKDAGLYAMNYGSAYVASVAVYGDFSQTLTALAEADAYPGPSVVMAYLPGGEDDRTKALKMLTDTKKAIEIGTWPLFRWDPSAEKRGEEQFQLDSEKIKKDLREFLDRQNHLTELSNRLPTFGEALENGSGNKMVEAQKKKAKAAFEALAGALEGPPLLVLFASDGGNAEKLAKKFAGRARTRGVAARTLAFDDYPIEDLGKEENVALFTSVAGQGEFPQNGREFWKAIQNPSFKALGDKVNVTVFGMGDSHYWPRKEDAHYYNKAGKDLHKRLLELGATPFVALGLGDDQDPDGPQTAYKIWEPAMWKALGVDNFESTEPELEPITNEHIKIASNFLRGTIAEGLEDKSTGALAESDGQLTKFHGIYQQDDRDIREERKAAGLEPAFSFMVRMRLPAGVCTPAQWLAVDEISDRRGNHTFKLTTRQTFQFHGIIKANLKPAIQEINKMALDTVAACGDVNRTVMCSANPSLGPLHAKVFAFATELSDQLKPQTSAYSEIWLDKKLVAGDAVKDVEPMYGDYYLPRKFKIAIAVPPTNDTDVYCHDLGYIAILDDKKELLGFNVTVGGGMGVTHSMQSTYPRLADVVGFITPEQGLEVAKAVLTTQRDNGNRANRKNARVKYTVDRMGIRGFMDEVEKRLGYKLQPARDFKFTSNVDEFGWQTGHDGKRHFTCFVENGRVQDEPGKPIKTGLQEVAKIHKGVFRLTANQHLIISDIPPEEEANIRKVLVKYKLDSTDFSGLRLSSAACVALPTCGLAMAESERYLPVLIGKVEKIIEKAGLRNDSITMRMTGCPNGCARPWAAEVAFVGKAPGSYLMMLGGGYHGERLNKPYREAVGEEEIIEILTPMIKSYALERLDGERFGDFVIRKGIISATTSGKAFYEGQFPGKEQ